MAETKEIKTLFVDIGGVLLTNGWDHDSRRAAALKFGFDFDEVEKLHRIAFPAFESGKLTLDEYLQLTIFDQERTFGKDKFVEFMFAQSRPYSEMIELVRGLKEKFGLKVIVVSNEGRELNDHRISKFALADIVDTFVSSCFVHLRKPDPEIFRLALDISGTAPEQIIYIENTSMFVDVAAKVGIRGIVHADIKETTESLKSFGLTV